MHSGPLPVAGAMQKKGTEHPARVSWLVLAASLALALAFYYGYLGSGWVGRVSEWTAEASGRALGLAGTPNAVDGATIASDSFAVVIVAECTAVGPLLLFVGAVAAYRSSLRAKVMGAALGLFALSGLNVARITSLFWVGSAHPDYLSLAHLLVWQPAMIVSAVVLWLLWVEAVARAGNV